MNARAPAAKALADYIHAGRDVRHLSDEGTRRAGPLTTRGYEDLARGPSRLGEWACGV